jgi:hypothetical protein
VAGAETSDTPAIAPEPTFVGDADQFLMTWKGGAGDEHLYQAISTDGAWSAPVIADGVATSSHPRSRSDGGRTLLARLEGPRGRFGDLVGER